MQNDEQEIRDLVATWMATTKAGDAQAVVRSGHTLSILRNIVKSHIDVLKSNAQGAAYWESQGWTLRTDIDRYSLVRAGGANA